MKVVLFCGGLGTRLREYSDKIPKPMVPVGYRPILWNIMKYYAHYGHKEFILCLGYKADMFKNYFINYDEYLSNDFVLEQGGQNIKLLNTDIHDWKITFVDTGMHSCIGERLMKVRHLVEEDEMFLANYTDTLTDLPLPDMLEKFDSENKVASFIAVRPSTTFHLVSFDAQDNVNDISVITDLKQDFRINGGCFVLKREIFNYMREGEELVEEPFQRLIKAGKLSAYKYDGFWAPMDTFKEKMKLDDMYNRGDTPWEVWKEEKLEPIPGFKEDKDSVSKLEI